MAGNGNGTQEKIIPCRDKVIPFGDDEAIKTAFREDGYVVISNVLSPTEIEAVLDEIWTSDNLLGKFDRNDPETWGMPSWPQQANGGRNFLASRDLFHGGCNWDVSSSPRQYHLQKLLWERDDLIMASLGRWGVMRPSGYNSEWRTGLIGCTGIIIHGPSLASVTYRQSYAWPIPHRLVVGLHVFQAFINDSDSGAKIIPWGQWLLMTSW